MITKDRTRIAIERRRPVNMALHQYGNWLWIWNGKLDVIGPTCDEPGKDAHRSGLSDLWYGRASADGTIATLYAPSVIGCIFPNARIPKILVRSLLRRWPDLRTLRLYTCDSSGPQEILV